MGLALVLVAYLYVPTVRTCYGHLEWNARGEIINGHCPEPEFSVPCLGTRRYYQEAYDRAHLCRTRWLRLVRIVENTKRQSRICQESWGWLSNYDRNLGCFCDYRSSNRDGKCVMSDEACQDLFGGEATAYVSDEDLGYPDQCGCPLESTLETCTAPKRGHTVVE